CSNLFRVAAAPRECVDRKNHLARLPGPENPDRVRIFHHKTGEVVLQPLEDKGRKLYPELEAYLAELPRLGVPIVVTNGSRGPSRPYAMVYAQAKVREARDRAGLGSHVALDACRHGGMTELGDAEFAEQGVMALSGHRTPQAARLYVKRTEHQRVRAAAKRRSFVEANETETRVDLEQKDRTEPFRINGASYGGRTRLFRLKISSFSNGFNWLCTFAAQRASNHINTLLTECKTWRNTRRSSAWPATRLVCRPSTSSVGKHGKASRACAAPAAPGCNRVCPATAGLPT